MADPDAKELIQRGDALKSARSVWESHWQEIRDYILPLVGSFTGTDTPGAKNRDKIVENSTETVSERFTAGVHGLMNNPGTKWMGLRAQDRPLNNQRDVALWLEVATDAMFVTFQSPESQFASQNATTYQEMGDFGTGGALYMVDRPGRLPLFQARPLSELFLAESDESVIDTVFRRPRLTARQAVNRWGARAGPKVVKAAESTSDKEKKFEFLHAVFPRDDVNPGVRAATALPFASIWVSVEDMQTIRRSGFHEFPYAIPRWRVRAGEVYGRGPGNKALADVKMLQRGKKATIRANEKSINPPVAVADDGILGALDLTDNGVTVLRQELFNLRRPPIETLFSGARPDLGERFLEDVRRLIAQAYYNDILEPVPRDERMTATQVIKLDAQALRLLGPFLGRVQVEMLGNVVKRTFGILLRAGLLPPPPEALLRRGVEVEYLSPIAKAQKLGEVSATSSLFDATAPLAAQDPEVWDNLDSDKAYRGMADRLGVPKDWLRDPRQVEQMRRARQETLDQASQAEQLERGASAAQSLGQAAAAFRGAQGGAPGGGAAAP